jgi:hypothetical protein
MPYREMFLIVFAALVAYASIWIATKNFSPPSPPVVANQNEKNSINTNVEPLKDGDRSSDELARTKLLLEQANSKLAQVTSQLPTNPPPITQAPSTGNSATAIDQANITSKIAALQSRVTTFLAEPNRNWHETGLTLFNELWEVYNIKGLSDEQNNSLLKNLMAMLQDALNFIKSSYKTMPQPQAIQFIDELQKHNYYISKSEQTKLEKLEKELNPGRKRH